MKNTVAIITLLFILLTIQLSAGTKTSGKKAQGVKIEVSEESWDFGYMPTNVKVSHSYWVRNRGSDVLEIVKITTDCGCTAAPISKKQIPPGDSAELRVEFDSAKMRGKMVKAITITSNDLSDPSHKVQFFATVKREHKTVKIIPNLIKLNANSKSHKPKQSLEIVNNSEKDIEIEIIDYPSNLYEVLLARQKIKAGGSSKIDVRLVQNPEKAGDISSSFTIRVFAENYFRITVPIIGVFSE